MSLPQAVSRDDWLTARTALLAREKELTRARDTLNADRRRLPMVLVDKEYVFDGPSGKASLLDVFGGRRQLMVVHFMFAPEWTDGCSSCSADADERAPGLYRHLAKRDTALVHVSRAPLAKIEDYKRRKGWMFAWYSSFGGDFNQDYGVTVADEVGGLAEAPGVSCFLRDGDSVFHTYSTSARGTEQLGGAYYYLDLTALGRQEEWEEPKGRVEFARAAVPDFSS
ncbi:MAG TPA: DUF899 domain-containing protein [Pseudonocardia sp.]|uniref:DUF899 domain-containing protein n=1 Tax=Pseudonocardia sp. TaxID=60912 RepID=UPI002ED8F71B